MKTFIIKVKDKSEMTENQARLILEAYFNAIEQFNDIADEAAELLGNPALGIEKLDYLTYHNKHVEVGKEIDRIIAAAKEKGTMK